MKTLTQNTQPESSGIRELTPEEIEMVSGAADGSRGVAVSTGSGVGASIARSARLGASVGRFGGLAGLGVGIVVGGIIGWGTYTLGSSIGI